jgi:flagellar protein FliS
MDNARVRFLADRVLTASPAQRIVMLFDRLVLDLTRATLADSIDLRQHTGHASQIVAELFGSLDPKAGGPAENLASIYGFLLKELMTVDPALLATKIPALLEIVTGLRTAWAGAVEELGARPLVGAWVG